MARVRGIPGGGADRFAGRLRSEADASRRSAIAMEISALQTGAEKRERILTLLKDHAAKREAEKQAKREEERSMWGGIAGGAAAVAGAPFTGGASLLALPSAVSAGTNIGRAQAGGPGAPAAMNEGLGAAQGVIDSLFTKNDAELTKPREKPVGQGGGGGVNSLTTPGAGLGRDFGQMQLPVGKDYFDELLN